MAKSQGMHKGGGTKSRGRSGRATAASTRSPTRPNTPIQMRTDVSRPVSSGVKKRGDRRDTSRQFTNNDRRQPNMGDPLGSGKKQIQGGGKGLKQSGGKRK